MTAAVRVEVREQPQWPKKYLERRGHFYGRALRVWRSSEVANVCQSQLSHSSLVHSAVTWRTLRRVSASPEKGWKVQRRRIIRNERRDLWMQFCSSQLWKLTRAHELFLWILKVTVKSNVYISDSLRNQLCISFSNWQSKIDLKKKKACCWGSFSLRVNGLLVMISCMAIKLLLRTTGSHKTPNAVICYFPHDR